jgi:hypothetical protein
MPALSELLFLAVLLAALSDRGSHEGGQIKKLFDKN